MKDLTKGKPSSLILSFAFPIFLANLLQLTYSLADTRIVGSFLGEDALAAVGSTSTVSNLIIGFLLGLANGFAIITAQRFGAKDIKGMKKSFAASILLGTGISLPGAPVALQDFSMAMASVVQRKVMIKRFSWEIMGYLLIDRIFGRKKFYCY